MPFKSERMKLQGLQDRRRKLTDEQKDEIRRKYSTGLCSTRSLASEYMVSRKTITLTVNEESMKNAKRYCADNWRTHQESRESHATTIRNHRRYKQELYLKGELKDE